MGQTLATEILKVKHMCPEITSNILIEGNACFYSLCSRNDFRTPLMKSVYHRTESISYLGPKRCDIVPEQIKKKPP